MSVTSTLGAVASSPAASGATIFLSPPPEAIHLTVLDSSTASTGTFSYFFNNDVNTWSGYANGVPIAIANRGGPGTLTLHLWSNSGATQNYAIGSISIAGGN